MHRPRPEGRVSAGPAGPPPPWHALESEQALAALQSSPRGLDDDAATERLREWGPNVLPQRPAPTLLAILLHQFTSPLIYVLLSAGAVALALGDTTDAGFLLAVVLLNAGLGTFQEWRAERSAAGLHRLIGTSARVTRGGVSRRVPAEELVPGAVVALESGDRVPADLRLLQVNHFAVDESFLTGESLPVTTQTAALACRFEQGDIRNLLGQEEQYDVALLLSVGPVLGIMSRPLQGFGAWFARAATSYSRMASWRTVWRLCRWLKGTPVTRRRFAD